MPDKKALQSQLNVLNARFNQIEDTVDYSSEKKEMLQAPIKRQIEKLEAQRDTLLEKDIEVIFETVKPNEI